MTWYEQFIKTLDPGPQKIQRAEFESWKKESVMDMLKGLRYGQSFCNKFDITDNLLYYCINEENQVNQYIEKNYLQ